MEGIQHENFIIGTEKRKHNNNNDLNEFLESFDKWQNTTETLMKEKSDLLERIDSLLHDKQKLVTKNEELLNQNSELQAVLDSAHKSLHRICDVEEDNRELRSKCEDLTKKVGDLNSIMEEKQKQHSQELNEIQKENENEKNELKRSFNVAMEKEKANYERQIQNKHSEILDLKEKLESAAKDNETEIVRISMEYENKMTKLRQKIQSSASHGSSSNQEIFRMKLQHMKNEYEREVRLLKEKISELEEKVVSPPGPNRMTFTSNKKRRY